MSKTSGRVQFHYENERMLKEDVMKGGEVDVEAMFKTLIKAERDDPRKIYLGGIRANIGKPPLTTQALFGQVEFRDGTKGPDVIVGYGPARTIGTLNKRGWTCTSTVQIFRRNHGFTYESYQFFNDPDLAVFPVERDVRNHPTTAVNATAVTDPFIFDQFVEIWTRLGLPPSSRIAQQLATIWLLNEVGHRREATCRYGELVIKPDALRRIDWVQQTAAAFDRAIRGEREGLRRRRVRPSFMFDLRV